VAGRTQQLPLQPAAPFAAPSASPAAPSISSTRNSRSRAAATAAAAAAAAAGRVAGVVQHGSLPQAWLSQTRQTLRQPRPARVAVAHYESHVEELASEGRLVCEGRDEDSRPLVMCAAPARLAPTTDH
jgi:xanthine/CO dehydrogenase XdhC/CoxF family maturation factor